MMMRQLVVRFLLALVLSACIGGHAFAQHSGKAGTLPKPVAPEHPPRVGIGGRLKPATTGARYLRVLVVFVRFAGDSARSESWPDPAVLPAWASTILDSRPRDIGRNPLNLSEYFSENSERKLTLIGDVQYVTTDSTEDYYHTAIPGGEENIRGHLIRDVFMKLAAGTGMHRIDFRRYDNWSYRKDFTHAAGRDGWIDMVWVITRNYHTGASSVGAARQRFFREFHRTSADFNVSGAPLEFNGVRIRHTSGFVEGTGSGIMVIAANLDKSVYLYDPATTKNGRPSLYGEIVHEFAHYLFGPGHFGNSDVSIGRSRFTSYFSGLSINSANGFGNALGLEKIRLGWIDGSRNGGLRVVRADERDVTIDLADPSVRTRGAVKVAKIEIPGTPQYFLIENRGWKGPFEARFAPYNGPQATLRPGVLVTHVLEDADVFPMTKARVLCADGRFRWKVVHFERTSVENNARDSIERESADAVSGYDEREKIFIDGYSRSWNAGAWPSSQAPGASRGPYPDCTNCLDADGPANDNIGDRYDLFEEGDVISPWSNPSTAIWSGAAFQTTPDAFLTVEVTRFNARTGAYTIRVRRGDVRDTAPSRPTGLRAVSGSCADLLWSPNREPWFADAAHPGSYDIHRSLDGKTFAKIGDVTALTTAFRDSCTNLPGDPDRVWYAIRAIDGSGRRSTLSEPVLVKRR